MTAAETTSASSQVFDCLVLSGGGAKGSYGAGAAKALHEYRRLRNIDHQLCYVGASAGALTAAVLATAGPDTAIEFWRQASNRRILGAIIPSVKYQSIKRFLAQKILKRPFSVYGNHALRRFIDERVSFDQMTGCHLLIAVTDYTDAKLKAYYYSDLFHQFVERDSQNPVHDQRLGHCAPIKENNLTDVLTASAAIPIFFPPVLIGSNWHIDGGVGNNTPTREAAYFLRYLEKSQKGRPGELFVVQLQPPRLRRDITSGHEGVLAITERTLEIYHHIHTSPIVRGWSRINSEVIRHEKRLRTALEELGPIVPDPSTLQEVKRVVERNLGQMGGPTSRLNVPIHRVEPTQSLGETLDFDQRSIDSNIKNGYQKMLQLLFTQQKISDAEYDQLVNLPLWS